MIRNLSFCLMGAVALASAANAADIYRAPEGGGLKDAYVPVNSWTGFYAGVNGGIASSGTNDVLDFSPVGSDRIIKPSGGFGGGQIGYNWQGLWSPHLVLGIEADLQGAGIDDAVAGSSNFLEGSKLDWFGTVRGRLGYAMDGTLLYLTGGFAYGGLHNTDRFGSVDFRSSGTATGSVIGGGIEQKLSPAWSLKGEYQYLNFGINDLTDPKLGSLTTGMRVRLHDDDFHTVRVGLNYHFGQAYAGGGGLKDAPYDPANSWTGLYLGVNGGLASSGTNDVFDFSPRAGSEEIKPSGGFGGGQIGYNWQGLWSPHLVLGIEADIQGAGIDDSITQTHVLEQSKLDWFGTVRGRLGYAMDGTLLYATGGFAYGGLDKTEFLQGQYNFKSSGTVTGYVAGGGIEHRISPAWSLKGEYQYLNFGENDLTDPQRGSLSLTSSFPGPAKLHDDDFHTVRVGLNYHFVPASEPLK